MLQRGVAWLCMLAVILISPLTGAEPVAVPVADKPAGSATPSFTAKERAWLDTHPRPRMGLWTDVPPYCFLNKAGQPQGILVDYARELEKRLDWPMEIVAAPSFNALWKMAMNKEVDLLVGATPSEKHLAGMNLTQTYIIVPIVLVVRSDFPFVSSIGDFRNKKVVVPKGHISEQFIGRDFPEIQLLPTDDMEEGLHLVSEGKADAYAGAMAVVTWQIRRLRITNLKIAANTPYKHSLAVAVRKDWPELISIVDKVLETMDDQTANAIYHRWIAIPSERTAWRLVLKTTGTVLAVAAIVLLLLSFWNRRLKREIRAREQAQREQERLMVELKEAMARVKVLNGLLPICSHCKKIRDDQGYWNQIEAYIQARTDAEFSHGICQECAKKYYPDMDLYDD